jgi:hypothetical protein
MAALHDLGICRSFTIFTIARPRAMGKKGYYYLPRDSEFILSPPPGRPPKGEEWVIAAFLCFYHLQGER